MNKKQQLGHYGENLACKYLKLHNYNIVERNFSCRQGEIDIIAYDTNKNELVFIEVKTRTNFNYGIPSEAVTRQKQAHIKGCIQYYLYINKIDNVFVRIDVIEIVYSRKEEKYKLNHLERVID